MKKDFSKYTGGLMVLLLLVPFFVGATEETKTYYVDKYFEKTVFPSGEYTTTKHIYIGEMHIADIVYDSEADTTETFYINSDHLGGTSVVTDDEGNIAELHDYYPFGAQSYEDIVTDSRTSKLFTGKEADPENLLYYFGARYYDQDIGKFVSVDPFGQRLQNLNDEQLNAFLSNPQRLNAYAYASNNPINRIDPDGELDIKAIFSPGAAAAQLAFWHSGINSYLRPRGYNISSSLLSHSLSWNPDNLNITSSNQSQYGDVVDRIRESSQYKTVVSRAINKAKEENRSYFTKSDLDVTGLRFSEGDLGLSLKKVDIDQLTGRLDDSGSWRISTQISDTYDFKLEPDFQTYQGDWFTTSANNSAYASQQAGVITKYDLKINFNDEIRF